MSTLPGCHGVLPRNETNTAGRSGSCLASAQPRQFPLPKFSEPSILILLYSPLQVIPGEEGAEVTSLAWVTDCFDDGHRLFCARLDGQVYELCLKQLRPKASTDSYGGTVWQLAPEPPAYIQPGRVCSRQGAHLMVWF